MERITDLGILYQGDTLNILKLLPDNSIDTIITDPHYNIADDVKLTKVGNKIVSNQKAWGNSFKDHWQDFETYSSWIISIFSELKRVLKDNGSIIAFFDRKYTGYFAYIFETKLNLVYRNKLYFIKNNPLPHFRKNNYRSTVEEAIWLTKTKKYFINFIRQAEMKQVFYGNIGKKDTKHPTEKYMWMIKPIVRRHAPPNGVVLDPFLGSGTTAIACESLGKYWIGIEKNSEYCSIAKRQILAAPRKIL